MRFSVVYTENIGRNPIRGAPLKTSCALLRENHARSVDKILIKREEEEKNERKEAEGEGETNIASVNDKDRKLR